LIHIKYPTEYQALERLFGTNEVESKLPRLNEIYLHAEAMWNEYIHLIPNGEVKYLLIAEAPPWSISGTPKYVLDPDCEARTLLRALCKAFLISSSKTADNEYELKELANKGWLILDTIPFSMDYKGKRNRKWYDVLIRSSAQSFFTEKLKHPRLVWSKDLHVAFSVKVNARSVLSALNGRLNIGHTETKLGNYQIAVDGSGYPRGALLREIYKLDETE
jgi:hypothetical protein